MQIQFDQLDSMNLQMVFDYTHNFDHYRVSTLDLFAGGYSLNLEIKPFAMVRGFFAACTPLEALLPSTLDCLHEVKCLMLLHEYFPALNKV